MFHMLYPLHLYKNIITNNESHNTPNDKWYIDCCHPKYFVHQLAALIFGYSFNNQYNYYKV